MKKRMILLASLLAIALISCQKDNDELLADDHAEEIKQLEETLGIKLKEVTEEEAENAIYIPYEDLKKYMKDVTLSRASGDPTPPPTITISAILRQKALYEFMCSLKGIQFCNLFSVDFEVSFRRVGNTSLNANSLRIDYPTGYLTMPVANSASSSGGLFKTYANANFRFSTTIGGRPYEFLASVSFEFKFPITSGSDVSGQVTIAISF